MITSEAKAAQPTRIVTIEEVMQQAQRCAARLHRINYFLVTPNLFGVPRGGIAAALAVATYLVWHPRITGDPKAATLIIDDVYDSGATQARFALECPNTPFEVLFDKREPPWAGQWLVFPWESGRDH